MNEYDEAYDRIEYFVYNVEKYGMFDNFNKLLKDFEVAKDFDTLFKLLDKTTPKKVLNRYLDMADCPNCNQKVWMTEDLFHHNKKSCFQRLDWSKDE